MDEGGIRLAAERIAHQNSPEPLEAKYRQKCACLGRAIRGVTCENAALRGRTALIQRRLVRAQRQCRALRDALANLQQQQRLGQDEPQSAAVDGDNAQSTYGAGDASVRLLDASGLPRLPLCLQSGRLTLISTGRLWPRPSAAAAASRRRLYPVGYTATRQYLCVERPWTDAGRQCLRRVQYTCRVLEPVCGGVGGGALRFAIHCAQWQPPHASGIVATSTDQCHEQLLRRLQRAPGLPAAGSAVWRRVRVCGDAFFGLSDPSVCYVLRRLLPDIAASHGSGSGDALSRDPLVNDAAVSFEALCSLLQPAEGEAPGEA